MSLNEESVFAEALQIQDAQVVPIYAEDFLGKPRIPLPPWNKR